MKKILYSIILCIAVCSAGVSQALEEKIISSELRELIRDYPDSTRVVIVALEADDHIKELQLKSETRSPYIDVPYNDRSAMALGNKSLQETYQQLLQIGEPYYDIYGSQTIEGEKTDSVHYYLFMNAFLFKVKAGDFERISELKKVKHILDGNKEAGIESQRQTANNISFLKTAPSLLNNKTVRLITERHGSKEPIKKALPRFDKKSEIIRQEKISINNLLTKSYFRHENISLEINLFPNISYVATVKRAYYNINGTYVIRAKLNDFDFSYATITTHEGRSLVNIDIPEEEKWFLVTSDSETKSHFVLELEYSSRQLLTDVISMGTKQAESAKDSRNEINTYKTHSDGQNRSNEIVDIDIMINYTTNAFFWADDNMSGIENVVAHAVDKANTVFENSEVGVNLRLMLSNRLNYIETGDCQLDLKRYTHKEGVTYDWGEDWDGEFWNGEYIPGFFNDVHEWRNLVGADLNIFLTATGTEGIAGRSWLLNTVQGSPHLAFSQGLVSEISTSYLLANLVGINMGAGRHKEQQDYIDGDGQAFPGNPGPTDWLDWEDNVFSDTDENEFSAGWRWRSGITGLYKRYCTVMTYESGNFFEDGKTHSRIPYFSNPDITYKGSQIGHTEDGNNAKTLREIKHVIANYRPTQEDLTLMNWGYQNVDISQLHNIGYKGQGLRIGIIDTGIDHNHPYINMVSHGEPFNNTKLNVIATGQTGAFYNNAKDDDGHGTAVAATAWQMAPQAEYIIFKMTAHPWWPYSYSSRLSTAVEFMMNQNVDVINHSAGLVVVTECPASNNQLHDSDYVFNNVFNQNIIPVNAAGNSNLFANPPTSMYPVPPGLGENVLSVFSIDNNNYYSQSSSPFFPCPDLNKPELAAPGDNVFTLGLTEHNTIFTVISGSSFAAPHTAGIAAILKQAAAAELGVTNNSALVMNSIKSSLLPLASNIDTWGDYQPGRINAWEAYQHMVGVDIETAPPTHVTVASALVGGEVISEGALPVTERGIYWGTEPDVPNTGTKVVLGSGEGEFSAPITGLEKNTTYYVQAYATNANTTFYGEELDFTTSAASNIFVYTAPLDESPAPTISLTPTTISLLNNTQQNNQPLTLSFEISHNTRTIQTARLFYKNTDSDFYDNVDLDHVDGNIYEYTITDNDVVPGSMNFFVSATDDAGQTVSLPPFQYLDYPYPIVITPNEPPQISHTPITEAMVGDELTIEAIVTDPTADVEKVELLFRRHDNAIYTVVEMTAGSNDLYSFDLPPITMAHYENINPVDGKNGLDYVIKAIDEHGAISYFPDSFSNNNMPQHVMVDHRLQVNFLVLDQYSNAVEDAEIKIVKGTPKSDQAEYVDGYPENLPVRADLPDIPITIYANDEPPANKNDDFCPEGSMLSNQPNGMEAYISSENVIIHYQSFSNISSPVNGLYLWGMEAFWDGSQWINSTSASFDLQIAFFSDNNGEPGSIVYSEVSQAQGVVDTEFVFGNWVVRRYELFLDESVNLADGWFGVYSINDPDNSLALFSSTDDNGHSGYFYEQSFVVRTNPMGFCLLGQDAIVLYTDNEGRAGFPASISSYMYIVDKEDHESASGVFVVDQSTVHELVILETNLLPSYELTLSTSPENAGMTLGGGVYEVGEEVTIEAIATGALPFAYWSHGDEYIGDEAVLTFNMPNENIALTAHFEPGGCQPDWEAPTNLENNMQIVAQLIIDDEVSLNPNDVLGAFVGDECRGVAYPMPEHNGLVFLNVVSNEVSGEMVELKIWNSELCESCDAGPGFEFISQGEIGTFLEPYEISCDFERELVLDFGQGFTWFSVNVNPGSMLLNPLFENLDPCVDDRVIGQTAFALFTGSEWLGGLTTIKHESMYRMRLCSNQTLTLSGATAPLDPIALNAGFTWLGYLSQSCLPVNEALTSLSPAYDDRIIGQNAFALYDGTQWIGTLNQMCPGEGYIIRLANQDELVYPLAGKSDIENLKAADSKLSSPTGVYPQEKMQHTMMLLAELNIGNGKRSLNPKDVVYALIDDEYRGMAVPTPENNGLIFMSIGNNSEKLEEVSFKVWLDEPGELMAINERITFSPLASIGTTLQPFVLSLDGVLDVNDPGQGQWFVGEPYPNPFSGQTTIPYTIPEAADVSVRLFNNQGQLIATINEKRENAGSYLIQIERGQLSTGLYFIVFDVTGASTSLQQTARVVIR